MRNKKKDDATLLMEIFGESLNIPTANKAEVFEDLKIFAQGVSAGITIGVKRATAKQRKKSTNQNT